MGNTCSQNRIITGRITDSQTKIPLASSSIYSLDGEEGVITDNNGNYTLSVKLKTDSIAVSTIGYETATRAITKKLHQIINFEMIPASGSLAGIVISVKVKFTKAQRLVKKVIENKAGNDAFNNKAFQSQVYDKIEVSLKNIPEKLSGNRLLRPLAFAFKNLDTTEDDQKVLPVYLSESNSRFYFKKNPEKERYDYSAQKSSGIENKSIVRYIDGLYKKINIYDDNIKLVDVNFISPVSEDALNYYNYNILDTVFLDNHRYIQVAFSPIHFGSNTFNGNMWIVDTFYAIKAMVMHIDKNANINYINKFQISQFFNEDEENHFFPEKTILYVDMNVPGSKETGVIATKTTMYKDIIINNDFIDTAFNKKEEQITAFGPPLSNSKIQRFEPLTKSEHSVYALMDTLMKIPRVVTYGKIISALSTGYYTTGPVDIGNIYSFYTSNHVEGNRFNFGLQTNSKFNGKLQLSGYAGLSTLDNRFKYYLSSLFVLNPKRWSTFNLTTSSDLSATYSHQNELDENSIFASLLRRVKSSQIKLMNTNFMEATYTKYLSKDVGIKAEINHNILTPFFDVYYTNEDFEPFIESTHGTNNNYTINEATISLRYSHKEKYITQHYVRGSLGSNYPIATLSYTKGIKISSGLLKSDFDFSKWNLNIQHDFTDGRIGQLSYTINAGFITGVLPIILLDVQKGNDTYYYNPYAFNNMNRFEFVADKYARLSMQQSFGSFPFRYFPLLKKLKWRSLVTFKGVLGDMSQANRIANGFYDTTINYHFTVPDKIPYMEAGVGINNIFHLIRIDAVWRLNYLNNPGISKFGIKGSLELKF